MTDAAETGGAVEATAAGLQRRFAGVAPNRRIDRLGVRAAAPQAADRAPRPPGLGRFARAARDQCDLFATLPPGRPDG